MPSRKQRRRRAKERRHDWEYVYVDDQGHEVEVDDTEVQVVRKQASQNGRVRATTRGRQVQPPSWRRVIKRGVLFSPIFFLMLTLLDGELTIEQRLAQTLWLLAIFVPFTYLLDRVMYRWATKRGAAAEPPQPARRR